MISGPPFQVLSGPCPVKLSRLSRPLYGPGVSNIFCQNLVYAILFKSFLPSLQKPWYDEKIHQHSLHFAIFFEKIITFNSNPIQCINENSTWKIFFIQSSKPNENLALMNEMISGCQCTPTMLIRLWSKSGEWNQLFLLSGSVDFLKG